MKKTFIVTIAFGLMIIVSLAFTKDQPKYKNLKILPKNITEKQMDSVMHHYTLSLNVGCEFCHVKTIKANVEEWDMASDKNKHKLVARDMMKMTNKLNDKYFPYGGKAKNMSTNLTVTCYTCHHGNKHPEIKPTDNK